MNEQRKYYLDNIKTIQILGLYLAHACEMYHLKEGFYIEGDKSLVPTVIYSFLTSWYMAVTFALIEIAKRIPGVNGMLGMKR